MKKILVISPHFDDAVLSAGQFMADRPDAEVVTVFGGFPKIPQSYHTPYDEKCGFSNAEDAVAERQRENDAATALLNATAINMQFPDGQYNVDTKITEIVSVLQYILEKEDYEFIMGPLGIGHPDHQLVNKAIRQLHTTLPIYFWEDMPLRVMEPQLICEKIRSLKLKPDDLMHPATTGDKMAKKIRSLLCYKSQIGTGILDPYIMYVPERFWRYQ